MSLCGWCNGPLGARPQHRAGVAVGACGCGCHIGRKANEITGSGGAAAYDGPTTKRDPSRVFGDPRLRSLDGYEGAAQ